MIVSPYYHPGRDAGGPVKSLKNLARLLIPAGYTFRVITKDRDLGARVPFSQVTIDQWNATEYGDVFYSASIATTARTLREECRTADGQRPFLYLNSFFSIRFGVLPVLLTRMGFATPAGIFVAPRGEFAGGALGHKPWRKRLFLSLVRLLGLYRGVIWHATNMQESAYIRDLFGRNANIRLAGNLSGVAEPAAVDSDKNAGELSVGFVARIVRIKNLHFALEALAGVKGRVRFTIYGPAEDLEYWEECCRLITALPPNITVDWRGPIDNDRIGEALAACDVFLLPTLGENFGHSIVEAMQAGSLPLISDRTPWRGLREFGAGWDLPLENPSAFSAALQEATDLDARSFAVRRARLAEYLSGHSLLREAESQNLNLFEATHPG